MTRANLRRDADIPAPRSAIARLHNGNLAAIRAEIEASTIEEIAFAFRVSIPVARSWESMYGARAARDCRRCGLRKLAKDMIQYHDGRCGAICQACDTPAMQRNRAKMRTKKAEKKADGADCSTIAGEVRSIPPALLMSPRWPISKARGYWNPYAHNAFIDAGAVPA